MKKHSIFQSNFGTRFFSNGYSFNTLQLSFMQIKNSLITLVIILFSLIIVSCGNENDFTEQSHLSEKILGKWVQKQSFNLLDGSIYPTAWEWNDVEHGFTLELMKDNSFSYSAFNTCSTGIYRFDPALQKIDFEFYCAIELFGEMTQILTEYVDLNFIQNQRILVSHASNAQTQKQVMSILERVK